MDQLGGSVHENAEKDGDDDGWQQRSLKKAISLQSTSMEVAHPSTTTTTTKAVWLMTDRSTYSSVRPKIQCLQVCTRSQQQRESPLLCCDWPLHKTDAWRLCKRHWTRSAVPQWSFRSESPVPPAADSLQETLTQLKSTSMCVSFYTSSVPTERRGIRCGLDAHLWFHTRHKMQQVTFCLFFFDNIVFYGDLHTKKKLKRASWHSACWNARNCFNTQHATFSILRLVWCP